MSLLYPLLPLPPLMQCAAVISRSWPGLETTLAVREDQKQLAERSEVSHPGRAWTALRITQWFLPLGRR